MRGTRREIPDPLAAERARPPRSTGTRASARARARLELTQALLAARHRHVAPLIPAMTTPGDVRFENGVLPARWAAGEKSLLLLANLSDAAKLGPAELAWGDPIWGGMPPATLPPWSVYAAIGSA